MKAIRVEQYGGLDALRYEDIPDPEPGEGEVCVKIEAAGVNFVDIYHRMGRYQEAITYMLKAIEFDHGNVDYWINLGYANEDAGLIEEAVKCYAYVTRVDSGDMDGWIALTSILMKEGYIPAAPGD